MNYRYRTDEEMKDSGVEWLGKIPKTWNIVRNKYIFREINKKSYGEDMNLLSVSEYYGVALKKDKISSNDFLTRAETLEGYKCCEENDLVMNIMLAWKKAIGISNYRGVVSPAYCVYRKLDKVDINTKYYHYLFRTDLYASIFKQNSTGIIDSRLRLYPEKFFGIYSYNICKSEQDKIVEFIDEKTAQFDSMISKKEALIEKLEEAKKSLISEVVTGKVKVVKTSDGYELVERREEEMKDSGVKWVTLIPNEWDLKRSNYVFKFSKGLSITKENLQDEGIPCINYGEIHSKYGFEVNPKKHKLKYVAEEYLNSNSNALIKYGDFVFADTSEDIKGCGNFSYLNSEDSIFAGYHTVIARPIKEVSSRYLAYLFDSDDWRIQIRTKVSGVKVFSITQSILKTTKVILPTLSEQKLIVSYLDNKFISIDAMINNMKNQIEKLKEAKQSLISEAVTGKIEVLD